MLYLIDVYNFLYTATISFSPQPLYDFLQLLIPIAERNHQKIFHLIVDGFSPPYYHYKTIPLHSHITITFSYEETADTLIKKQLATCKNPNETALVTNDRELQQIAKNRYIKVVPIPEFEKFLFRKLE